MDRAWEDLCDVLRARGTSLIADAPDERTRAEGLTYLSKMMAYGIERILLGADRVTDGIDFTGAKFAGSNPDYRVGASRVDAEKIYKVVGRKNDSYRLAFGVYSSNPDATMVIDDYKVMMDGSPLLNADGAFEFEVGPSVDPARGLRMTPTSNTFIVRDLLLDKSQRRADVALIGNPTGADHRPPTPEQAKQSLMHIKNFFEGNVSQFQRWSAHFARLPNEIEPLLREFDDKTQGDADSRYWTGYFELKDDQALVVEIPEMECDYWGLALTNHWQEPLPNSFTNHARATKDADGKTRVVIALRDPGLSNWLSTEGRSRGIIWHRRVKANNEECPRCELRSLEKT